MGTDSGVRAIRAMLGRMSWSERLSQLDATFLHIEENPSAHMHVGALVVFRGKPPSYRDLLAHIESRLEFVPRYRQRVEMVPFGRPVWVDDAHFDLEYHVRHSALPRPDPGEPEDAPLKRLAGRVLSQRLDRHKPLWELWFVEGLGDDRFAIISKTHHAMVDGVSGVDLATVLLDADPTPRPIPKAKPWEPREAPGKLELAALSFADQLKPWQLARDAWLEGTEARKRVEELAAGLKPLLGIAQLDFAPASPLNKTIGPHRRFETLVLPLARVKEVRAGLGGTVNDVVLAVVAGGLRTFLRQRGEPTEGELRVMVPVSVRSADQRGTFGNQVAAMFCPLPIGEPDPAARLARVRDAMQGLKESRQAVGAATLTRLGDFAPPTMAAQAARLLAVTRSFNLVVTNVPGPPFPLYLLGCELDACYPVVPLAAHTTVGIALLSNNGRIGVGITADADRARDVGALAIAMERALDELVAIAKAKLDARASLPSGA
jgi:WS/DGAT/MGAT family acyltransferase